MSQPIEVVDMSRALAEYMRRWRAIPAEQRQAIVKREQELRARREAHHVHSS